MRSNAVSLAHSVPSKANARTSTKPKAITASFIIVKHPRNIPNRAVTTHHRRLYDMKTATTRRALAPHNLKPHFSTISTRFFFPHDRPNKQTRFNPSLAHLPVSEANKTGEKQLPGASPRLRIEPVPSFP
jgi:hypothetical protein